MFLNLTVRNGFWPWLFDHSDDIGVFLRIGGNDIIRWYAICILTGMVLCLVRCKKELKRKNIPTDYYDNFFVSVVIIALIGARLWYVISEPDEFNRGNLWDTLLAILGYQNGKFALSGLAVQGGVLAGLIWGCIYFSFIKKRYPLALHVDLIVPCIFIGQILGRWGNFFNGEVYGKTVSRSSLSWWIPKFIIDYCTGTGANSQVGANQVHIPLFYVEMLLNIVGYVLIGFLIWRYWKKGRKPYQVGSLYFIYYGIVRLCLEPLRSQEYIMTRTIFGLEVRTSILMSIIFIVGGVFAFVFFGIYYRKVPYDKIYTNVALDAYEEEQRLKHEEELNAKIAAKKAEIRARKELKNQGDKSE